MRLAVKPCLHAFRVLILSVFSICPSHIFHYFFSPLLGHHTFSSDAVFPLAIFIHILILCILVLIFLLFANRFTYALCSTRATLHARAVLYCNIIAPPQAVIYARYDLRAPRSARDMLYGRRLDYTPQCYQFTPRCICLYLAST